MNTAFDLRKWANDAACRAESSMIGGKVLAVLDELDEYRTEDLRQREWVAFCAESEVRCLDCGTTYSQRQTYSCGDPGMGPHSFDEAELAEARRVPPSHYGSSSEVSA